jgi:predicted RNA-binding protein with PIN domain
MPYLIDGNNFIGAIREIDIRDEAAREKLTRLLARYQRAKNNSVIVVYDGPPPPGVREVTRIGGLTVIYAGPRSDADTRIRRILEESADPASFIVVSSDRQVYSFARWRGAEAMRVMRFYEEVRKAAEGDGGGAIDEGSLSSEEIGEWMRFFGLDNGSEGEN